LNHFKHGGQRRNQSDPHQKPQNRVQLVHDYTLLYTSVVVQIMSDPINTGTAANATPAQKNAAPILKKR
jgi:hypothetical protein